MRLLRHFRIRRVPKQYGAQLVSEERRITPEISERHCWLLNSLDDGWMAEMGIVWEITRVWATPISNDPFSVFGDDVI